ncbi:hypothetical protein CEQ90_14495 [Lewinellaceae bacterium SD302]|nr:hypothetical protein CEQ90_14495 [Lewinellaceae bacterium SD302]
MDYLDYLPDTPYEELPEEVKASITEADYAGCQLLATEISLTEASTSLPMVLPVGVSEAYRKRQSISADSEATTSRAAGGGAKIVQANWRYRLSLAASLFLAATTLTLILWQSKEKIIYKLVSAPVPDPVLLADTIYLDRTVEKVVYRDQVDTVIRYLPSEPRYVYLTDTVYRPGPDSVPLPNGSKPAAQNTRLLDLLAPAD